MKVTKPSVSTPGSDAPFNVTFEEVLKAQAFLKQYLQPSPLLRNAWLSEQYDCDLYLKLENMLPIGSFKIRGASYQISKLSEEERKRGVIAASAGNHAQGVAWGSRLLGISAQIVMPKTAPLTKILATKSLGAEVILAGNNYDEAYAHARELIEKTGRNYIHAFEDPAVIAGQGTATLEILEQLPGVDWISASIGGGGLMSGAAVVLRSQKPSVGLIGCQAAGAPAMVRSIQKGAPQTQPSAVHTFADGIAVGKASPKIFEILKPALHDVVEVDDEHIASAVLTLLEKAKILAEGSAAIALAALDSFREKIRGKKVVVIISGGNIDVNILSRIIDRGMIRAGRKLRMNVVIEDRPGSLARLTQLLAAQGANVLQAIHDRSEPTTLIDQTEVALTLETRGPEHSQEVIQALQNQVVRLELTH